MKTILAALALRLLTSAYGVVLPAAHPEVARVEEAAADLARAMELEGIGGDVRLARSALVMSWYESALYADPKGSNDHGRACGVGQVHVADAPKGLLDPSWTCEAVRADRVVGYRAELRVIASLRALCGGDLVAGWNAYATGSCPKKDEKPIPLVVKRMREAGILP